ncbi:MAG: T9SS type A sorting domain-containing protein [Flavihumibacter sp.]
MIGRSFNGYAVDSYFDNLSLTSYNLLPVKLISFTAILSAQGSSALKWETSQETNNAGFYIERSASRSNWETIGFASPATNNALKHQYQFTDAHPLRGINYYRLKQVDLDGKYEYSGIINVKYQYSKRASVFPNPASDILSVVTGENKFSVQVINMNGNVVARFTNQKNLQIQQLPAGLYYLRLEYDNGGVENLKFLKR